MPIAKPKTVPAGSKPPGEKKKGKGTNEGRKHNLPKNPYRLMPDKRAIKRTAQIKLDKPRSGVRADYAFAHNKAQQQLRYGNAQQYGPYGSQTWEYDQYGNPVVKQSLSPEQQKLYDQDVALSQMARDFASGAMQRFAGQGPFEAKLSDRPLPAQLDEARYRMEGEAYNRLTRDLDQKQALELDQLQQRLANQGIPQGSDLYRKEMDDFQKYYQRTRDEARQNAIAIGGQELERTFGIGETRRADELKEQLAGRQQQYGELGAFSQFGTGVRQPQFQGFQGASYDPSRPTDIFNAFEQLKQGWKGLDLQGQQIGLQAQALAQAGRGGGEPPPSGPPLEG